MDDRAPEARTGLTARPACALAVGALLFLDEREMGLHLLAELGVQAPSANDIPDSSKR
jgi:hypothetical protein